ncbi:helix-turn-helix domain-containing protein [Halalkalicoccus salilacus]|uniref:helix-turn-helix domain-containing protein n=1 Tax=Halalkalicoccus TaxID=332246 RepID=UPI002F966EBB
MIITELTIPAEQFALSETLSTVPEAVVDVDQVVAHTSTGIMPYFWTAGPDYEEFERAAKNDPSVEELARIDEFEEGALYRAKWVQNVECVVYTYTEPGATLLDVTGRDEHWELQLRFDNEDDLTQFRNYVSENKLGATVQRLYQPSHPPSRSQPVLTEKQREVVIAGLRSGYYEIPRETRPSELAEEFEISQQALSKRFRRAHRALAENEVTVTLPEDE